VGSAAGGLRARRVGALAIGLCATVTTVLLASNVPVIAQTIDPDPTTTTAPPEPTTTTAPPDTTTTTAPPDTTTTLPPDTTTTLPADTTTTLPADTTTTLPPPVPGLETDVDLAFLNDLLTQVGKLTPGEALVSRPEFASLSGHQRDLVQELQTATDAFAIRRFALYGFTNQVAAAKLALKNARAAENEAVLREIIGLADAAHSDDNAEADSSVGGLIGIVDVTRPANADDQVSAFRALQRHLAADRKEAHAARVRAEDALATANENLANLTKVTTEALAERNSAESAIENELGSGAVRARPDGISATLAAAQAGQGDASGPSDLELPIPGAPLSSPFGLRNDPLSNGAGFHPGIDFGASSGTPIHAAGAGVVVMAGDCGGYGFCVVIDHGDSIATLYGHQSQLGVSAGQHVEAGQVIGYVGSTGASTGPHLHFEVRDHGLPIDPVLALLPS
jgi:murein DD-endopeptidase MepM/ murein hydrolase activator NlpD